MQALIADTGKGASLAIRDGDQDLWTREATRHAPRIRGFTARPSRDAVRLAWDVETASGDLEVWVQWTAGDGEWRALATALTDGEAAVPITLLPPGQCTLRLLASDGFQASVSRRVRVMVPERGPDVSILAPREGETLLAGNVMRLHGASTEAGDPEKEHQARWLIDGKEVAKSLDAFIAAPGAGRHTLELRVGTGKRAGTDEVWFTTIALEHEAQRLQG